MFIAMIASENYITLQLISEVGIQAAPVDSFWSNHCDKNMHSTGTSGVAATSVLALQSFARMYKRCQCAFEHPRVWLSRKCCYFVAWLGSSTCWLGNKVLLS